MLAVPAPLRMRPPVPPLTPERLIFFVQNKTISARIHLQSVATFQLKFGHDQIRITLQYRVEGDRRGRSPRRPKGEQERAKMPAKRTLDAENRKYPSSRDVGRFSPASLLPAEGGESRGVESLWMWLKRVPGVQPAHISLSMKCFKRWLSAIQA